MTEREFAVDVVRKLRAAKFEALWAGGCVRDELLGLTPNDYDVATSALPEQVQKLFLRTVSVGKAFGVIDVLGPRPLKIQVATFRKDIYDRLTNRTDPGPAGQETGSDRPRDPDRVEFCSAQEDAQRRDFTINGMFFDPLETKLIDYVGGQKDLENKVLRAIGDPTLRFTEDMLRMLRAVRMAMRFNLTIEPATRAAIRAMAPGINDISAERITEELAKMLVHPRRADALNLLLDLGLIQEVLPELVPMKGLPQGPPSAPTGDLWDHVMRVVELLGPQVSFPLAFAALLHDVGKPRCIGRAPDRYTFYHHEHIGRRLAEEIGLRLKLSNADRVRIEWLVEKHQILADVKQMRVSKVKKVLAHPGIRELLDLHRADALATGKSLDHVDYAEQLLAQWPAHELQPEPILTGDDLIAHGLTPGKLFAPLLAACYDAQLEGTLKSKVEAIQLVDRLVEEWQGQPPKSQSKRESTGEESPACCQGESPSGEPGA